MKRRHGRKLFDFVFDYFSNQTWFGQASPAMHNAVDRNVYMKSPFIEKTLHVIFRKVIIRN